MKKQFVTPRVIQQVPVQLEQDLLQMSITDNEVVTILGHDYVDHELEYVNQDQGSYWE